MLTIPSHIFFQFFIYFSTNYKDRDRNPIKCLAYFNTINFIWLSVASSMRCLSLTVVTWMYFILFHLFDDSPWTSTDFWITTKLCDEGLPCVTAQCPSLDVRIFTRKLNSWCKQVFSMWVFYVSKEVHQFIRKSCQ